MKEIRGYLSRRNRLFAAVAATVGACLANFSGPILLKLAPLNSSLAVIESILKVTGNLLLASTIAVFLALSIKIARMRGFTAKRVATIALFCMFSMALAAMTYKVNAMFNDFVKYVTTQSAVSQKMLKDKMALASTLDSKAKISFLIAQDAYEKVGMIINYIDINGIERRFQPDQEAIKNREMLHMFQTMSKMQNLTTLAIIIIWSLSTVIAVIFGITCRVEIEGDT